MKMATGAQIQRAMTSIDGVVTLAVVEVKYDVNSSVRVAVRSVRDLK